MIGRMVSSSPFCAVGEPGDFKLELPLSTSNGVSGVDDAMPVSQVSWPLNGCNIRRYGEFELLVL